LTQSYRADRNIFLATLPSNIDYLNDRVASVKSAFGGRPILQSRMANTASVLFTHDRRQEE